MNIPKRHSGNKLGHVVTLSLLAASSLSACSNMPDISQFARFLPSEKRVQGLVNVQGKQLQVWFVKTENSELQLVAVERPLFGSDPVVNAVEQLLRGPEQNETEAGIASEIPRGTILLDVKHEGNTVVLNLSKRFSAGSGPESMETRIEQLSKTVKSVAGDSEVYLNVEGQRLTASSIDGLEINQPL